MKDLSELQIVAARWRGRNFPPSSLTTDQQFMGMVEEMGELAHHIIKRQAGIRGESAIHDQEIIDGVCDLIIFATGLATAEGFDLGRELIRTWNTVKQRDWVKDPLNGKQ